MRIILALGVVSMLAACGVPISNDPRGDKTARITCYDGGEKIVDEYGTKVVSYDAGYYTYEAHGNVVRRPIAECYVAYSVGVPTDFSPVYPEKGSKPSPKTTSEVAVEVVEDKPKAAPTPAPTAPTPANTPSPENNISPDKY